MQTIETDNENATNYTECYLNEAETMIYEASDRRPVKFLDNNRKGGKRRSPKEWD